MLLESKKRRNTYRTGSIISPILELIRTVFTFYVCLGNISQRSYESSAEYCH